MIRTQNQGLGTSQPVPVLSPFPGWARHDTSPAAPPGKDLLAEAAFTAGAALAALSSRVHAAAPWSGVWRRRLALKAAAASVKNARRGEDELLLRDSFVLCPAGGDPGPGAGCCWPGGSSIAPIPSPIFCSLPRQNLGLVRRRCFARRDRCGPRARGCGQGGAIRRGRHGKSRAGAPPRLRTLCSLARRRRAGRRLGWPLPVPLLAAALLHPSLRTAGRRPHPGDPGWTQACCAAYALAAAQACDLHAELGRRAEKLLAPVHSCGPKAHPASSRPCSTTTPCRRPGATEP